MELEAARRPSITSSRLNLLIARSEHEKIDILYQGWLRNGG